MLRPLVISTLHKPVAYQERDGVRQTVDASFVLKDDHIRFDLGNYDHNRELVIDPQLSYASYLGGNGDDEGFGIAVDRLLVIPISPAKVIRPLDFQA